MSIVILRPPSSGSLTEFYQQINIDFVCLPVLPTPPTPSTTREYCSKGLFEESFCLEAMARLGRLLEESSEFREGKGIVPCCWTTVLVLLLLCVVLSFDRSLVALLERLLCRLERENVPGGKVVQCCCACCSLMTDAAKKRFVASKSLLDIEVLVYSVKCYSSGHCHMIWKSKPFGGKWMQ